GSAGAGLGAASRPYSPARPEVPPVPPPPPVSGGVSWVLPPPSSPSSRDAYCSTSPNGLPVTGSIHRPVVGSNSWPVAGAIRNPVRGSRTQPAKAPLPGPAPGEPGQVPEPTRD